METARKRIIDFIENQNIKPGIFLEKTGLKKGFIDRSHQNSGASDNFLSKILEIYPSINAEWLLTGNGEMLKEPLSTSYVEQRRSQKLQDMGKRIPFYDDVHSVGGTNELVASTQGVSRPTDYIDAGDWFSTDVTSAMRHYGSSMKEYPSGCILALKEVNNKDLIIWGRNYVVETDEYRITKRLQRGKKDGYLTAYSSNDETYPDGTLIHEPVELPVTAIKKISLVLGSVVKEHGSAPVYNKKKA